MYIHKYNLIKHIDTCYTNEMEFLDVANLTKEDYDSLLHDKKIDLKIAYKIFMYAKKNEELKSFFYTNRFL